MANRPVFVVCEKSPYYSVYNAEFEWAGGFAASQKQKNIASMHRCFTRDFPGGKALEISSKSTEDFGVGASAFFLKKHVPSINGAVPVENVYQSGKVFSNGGPYKDLLEVRPIDAKRDERLNSSGRLIGFDFEGERFPITPKTAFYDFIYVNALIENPDIAKELVKYDGFTDIEFNPEKSLNTQARAAAIYVSLVRCKTVDKAKTFDGFISLFIKTAPSAPQKQPEIASAPAEIPQIERGTIIIHKTFGKGAVKDSSGQVLKIEFESVGEKTLGLSWVLQNCNIEH